MKSFDAAKEAAENDVGETDHLNFQRAYRLTPIKSEADDYIAQARIGASASQNVLLPYATGLGYFVVPTSGADVEIAAGDFRVASSTS